MPEDGRDRGADTARRTETRPDDPNSGSHRRRILIVEDNDFNLKFFRDLLQFKGYQTLETQDGWKALELIRAETPDLIVMDVQLNEITGLEITEAIRQEDGIKDIPIVAVTAYAMKGDEKRILEAGCDAWLCKPVSSSELLKTIEKLLN